MGKMAKRGDGGSTRKPFRYLRIRRPAHAVGGGARITSEELGLGRRRRKTERWSKTSAAIPAPAGAVNILQRSPPPPSSSAVGYWHAQAL